MYLLVNVLEQTEKLAAIRTLCGDLTAPGKGIMFAMPLAFVEGIAAGE